MQSSLLASDIFLKIIHFYPLLLTRVSTVYLNYMNKVFEIPKKRNKIAEKLPGVPS